MASHGVRKLGVITGIFMVLFLFLGTFPPVDLYILYLPSPGNVLRFYVWGFLEGTTAVNMLTLAWPSCLVAWITTIFFFFGAIMTISASTPGSLSANSKRLFAMAATFCIGHVVFYVMIIAFSSYAASLFLYFGPGFYLLIVCAVSNIISWVKVQ
nr:hypothetical protein [Candidatus Sigynarchaeota archaeon]